MLTLLGVILNLGVVIYLGVQLMQCMGPEQIEGLHAAQNPLILSFLAVVGLFISLKG
jgi:hypothetical protein